MPKTEAFKKLKNALSKEYVGRIVPEKYQKRYGKRYDDSEMESLAYAVARSRGIKIDKGGKF